MGDDIQVMTLKIMNFSKCSPPPMKIMPFSFVFFVYFVVKHFRGKVASPYCIAGFSSTRNSTDFSVDSRSMRLL
jgi:hypothetical protein